MHVTFQIKDAKTNLGESLFLAGDRVELGKWDVSNSFANLKNIIVDE